MVLDPLELPHKRNFWYLKKKWRLKFFEGVQNPKPVIYVLSYLLKTKKCVGFFTVYFLNWGKLWHCNMTQNHRKIRPILCKQCFFRNCGKLWCCNMTQNQPTFKISKRFENMLLFFKLWLRISENFINNR